MISEIDFNPIEEKILSSMNRFEFQLKTIKVGKLTPDTFKNIKIF